MDTYSTAGSRVQSTMASAMILMINYVKNVEKVVFFENFFMYTLDLHFRKLLFQSEARN